MPTSNPRIRSSGGACSSNGWSSSHSETGSTESSMAPDFPRRPLQVTWEMTQVRAGKAAPARAAARAPRDRHQFSTAEAFHLVAEAIVALKASGLMRVAFWLHGSTAALDDAYWAVPGSHRRTLAVIGSCHEVQLPVQINTILARRNLHDVGPMIELLTHLDMALWKVFFFVPPSREQAGELLTADEHEQIFAKLYAASKVVHFEIKTTEGQHYQRYVLQQRVRESRGRMTEAEVITCPPKGVNEGKGFVFINHRGEVYPSRFLPLSAGNVTTQSLPEVYCDSPLFVSLRDSSRLKGKCGRCLFRDVCGGSRARAHAVTGDLFAADPCCAYEP